MMPQTPDPHIAPRCICGGRIVPETNRGVEHLICTECSACNVCDAQPSGEVSCALQV